MVTVPKWLPVKPLKWLARHVLPPVVTAFVILVAVFVLLLNSRADLDVWHLADLDSEFTRKSDAESFADYLAIEDALYAELDERVYDEVEEESQSDINRFTRGSLADPRRWDRNWNRTFVLDAEEPTAGVLLIHGMSDSPYSMRNLALTLHEHGASVVGLRVPGHGTAPSGLVKVRWQDMAAAVRLAMQHVRDQAGDKPVVLIGYSNGGALALEYALTAIQQDGLRRADGIVLISPAVGVSKLAAFAVWQGRLGRITTLDKLAWNSISLEFDPYKYSSFAVNAGDQTFRLTTRIQSQLEDLRARGSLYEMPPVLAFQSALDATVSTPALVNRLFRRLSEGDHELVVFDVNRTTTIQSILVYDPRAFIENLLKDESLPFTMRLITNRKDDREDVMEVSREPGRGKLVQRNLPYSWPDGVFSLSHVALPFPEDDPLYGRIESELNPGYQLGGLELRGERGMSRIGESRVLRLHWNPFYDYLAQRVVDFVKAPPAGE